MDIMCPPLQGHSSLPAQARHFLSDSSRIRTCRLSSNPFPSFFRKSSHLSKATTRLSLLSIIKLVRLRLHGHAGYLGTSITWILDPWLGNFESEPFRSLEDAVVGVWKQKPLYIREGGSIPAIKFLEKELGAPAAQLPCGQASDNAHLENERLRVINLHKSREIFRRVFKELPRK